MITLYAGDKQDSKSFLVHSSFAVHYSPVLKAAFSSDFVEGKTQEYRLDEESEEVVQLLIHCRCSWQNSFALSNCLGTFSVDVVTLLLTRRVYTILTPL